MCRAVRLNPQHSDSFHHRQLFYEIHGPAAKAESQNTLDVYTFYAKPAQTSIHLRRAVSRCGCLRTSYEKPVLSFRAAGPCSRSVVTGSHGWGGFRARYGRLGAGRDNGLASGDEISCKPAFAALIVSSSASHSL
ncbi:unnamed protein product [Mycena citricolor]|uniref:Uncharacterized protein n=1 Tax=Mycena citricolor TaxID=2018698 RepID=A0AAD2H0V1_9AGAR|nr:unnamed protein product [Mycena citricolor]